MKNVDGVMSTLGTMVLLSMALGASAQTGFPEKPVRVVAPFPAGTGADCCCATNPDQACALNFDQGT
jgi:tripartite-type tricarboxylate transporter receptor subunit TctC